MFSTKTFAVVLSALLVNSALALDCTRTYTVKEGDICDSISAANGVSTYQLAVVNNGMIDSTCSNLAPGSQLCLGTSGEDCTDTYVVQQGDSCDAISEAHGFNSTILSLNNPQINQACDNVYVGEVLCVAKDVQVPPPPANGIPATTIPATALPAVPSPTKAPVVETPAAPKTTPAPKPTSTSDDTCEDEGDDEDCDDEDDDNLPFCDEI